MDFWVTSLAIWEILNCVQYSIFVKVIFHSKFLVFPISGMYRVPSELCTLFQHIIEFSSSDLKHKILSYTFKYLKKTKSVFLF